MGFFCSPSWLHITPLHHQTLQMVTGAHWGRAAGVFMKMDIEWGFSSCSLLMCADSGELYQAL